MSAASSLRGWETRREREERVTVNLVPDALALWARVGRLFRGSPELRREAFEQYMHDHPGEAAAALADASDVSLEAMLDAHEAPTPAELAAEHLTAGAIQVLPGVWSLDPRALFALASEAGEGNAIAFMLPGRDDGEGCEVTVDAAILLAAARVAPADAWTCDLTADGLSVRATLRGRGFTLCGGRAHVAAAVALPEALPRVARAA